MEDKNLVIYHLESIDTLHFVWNEERFPNISRFKTKCMDVKYHYSNATSTFMSMNDILFGEEWWRFESTVSFGQKRDITDGKSESLLEYYRKKGYDAKIIEYPGSAAHFDIKELVRHKEEQVIRNSRDGFYDEIDSGIKQDRFALYIWDASSHLNCMEEDGGALKKGYDRRLKGYESVDVTFANIITILEKYDKLKNTVILLFGDHGDDYWFHGLEGGYVHGTAPYSNITITPLLIYDGQCMGKDIEHVISTTDINAICKRMTAGAKTQDALEACSRPYVFSRNLFAKQRRSKYRFRLKKGYSIANRKYIMMLDEDGYQMFYINLDMENACNILNFFRFCHGKVVPFKYYDFMVRHRMIHFHFINLINQPELEDIKRNFYFLRGRLMDELNRIASHGVEIDGRMRFNHKINYTKNYRPELASLMIRGIMGRIKERIAGQSVWNETI